jgi:hypothetical protein
MLGRNHSATGGHVRSRIAALTLAAGLAASGTLAALAPSTAGAATPPPNPLGPTIAQLQAAYASALIQAEGADATLLEQVGCLVLTVERDLGLSTAPLSRDCII